jgi:LmbE family N-acetylglucosaminyl deacetylase
MVTVRSLVALTVVLAAGLGVASGAAAGTGPVLVVVAHPGDEGMGMAGVIKSARDAGRPVYVAVATNGDVPTAGTQTDVCGAGDGSPSATANYGLIRNTETMNAMGMLGLGWSIKEESTNIFFLGYPDSTLTAVAAADTPYTGDATGLHHTYAEDGDGMALTCNGDLRYLLSRRHSTLTRAALQADLDSLLALTQPSDIYTHTTFDGHSDNAEVARQIRAAAMRAHLDVVIHGTLIRPQGTGGCQPLAVTLWPNPAFQNNDVYARFTPKLDATAPPTPACSATPTGSSWGPEGAPDELVEVPAAMQAPIQRDNLKWRLLMTYTSQLTCGCGFYTAFVKKREFFWTEHLGTSAPPPPPQPPPPPSSPPGPPLSPPAAGSPPPSPVTSRTVPGSAQVPQAPATGAAPTKSATATKLVLTVGPRFIISLRTASGKVVRRLKSGGCSIEVRDRSVAHNAHLMGAGVNRKTGVIFKDTVTWRLTLKKGTLTFLSDPDKRYLRGSVEVL